MTRPRLLSSLLSLALVALLCAPGPAQAQAGSSRTPGISVTASDAGGLEVVCTPPAWDLKLDPEGQVELPYQAALIALPPSGEPTLSYTLGTVTRLQEDSELVAGVLGARQASAASLVLEEIAIYRGARLARLVCRPFWAQEGALYVAEEVRGRIAWPAAAATASSATSPDPLAGLAGRAVLNPQHLRWASPLASDASVEPASSAPRVYLEVAAAGLHRLDLQLLSPWGFGGVALARLRLWQDADELPLTVVDVDGDGAFDSVDQVLFYVAPRSSRWQATDTLYLELAQVDGLRMTARSGAPSGDLAVALVDAPSERNVLYSPDSLTPGISPGRDGDRWFWLRLQEPGAASDVLTFNAPDADTAQPAELTLWLVGQTTFTAQPDHRLQVMLNGYILDVVAWDGRTTVSATLPIDTHLLLPVGNVLTLTALPVIGVAVDAFWLDALSVRYVRAADAQTHSIGFAGAVQSAHYTVRLTNGGLVRAVDVTDPFHPQWLTDVQVADGAVSLGDPDGVGGRRYFVSDDTGLRTPTSLHMPRDPWLYTRGVPYRGADLLLIAHPNFIAALAPLAAYREEQGLDVAIVNVEGLYDDWGDGRVDPEAIRRFVREAYENWRPRPSSILLVGDGSYDPRGYRTGSPPTYLPPYLADVDPWGGETAADNRYACVDGDDALADLAVGRWPVTSLQQTSALVTKVISYEVAAPDSAWAQRVVLVADDADQGGDFAAVSDDMATRLPLSLGLTRLYCAGSDPFTSDCSAADAASLHTALRAHWGEGALLVEYTGHSSWQQWSGERFLHVDDAAIIGAPAREPILADWTCFTGAFHRPESTLDEQMVLRATGGAIAAWGPVGLGVTPAHAALAEGLHNALVQGGLDLGQAVTLGKLNLYTQGPTRDLLDTFGLLGDPALRLPVATTEWTSQYHMPILMRQGQLP